MKHNVDTKKFTVYQLISDEKVYVAILKEYMPVVEQHRLEFGSIDKVPSDKTVRGVFLKKVYTDQFQLPENS